MQGRWSALVSALTVCALLGFQAHAGAAADYWLMTHAGANGGRIGDYWTGASDPSAYPAESVWDPFTAATAEFGGGHASCLSTLRDGLTYTYAYADAAWSDTVTVSNPGFAYGELMPVYLHFDLEGFLSVLVTGQQPPDTTTEGRAAVTADVKSDSLAVIAHGYNMWATNSVGGSIMRSSGNWPLGGWANPSISGYSYDNPLALAMSVPNGIAFDLLAKISVATGAWMTYTGPGSFPGRGDYDITAIADFTHSMTFGGFTDAGGTDIRDLGYVVGSNGPTFPPYPVPEPAGITLAVVGALSAFVLSRRRCN